jgi:hypothetical protein
MISRPDLVEVTNKRAALWRLSLRERYPDVPHGLVLYRGPSLLGPGSIVTIVTGLKNPIQNRKTADLLQVYILPADEAPTEAVVSGSDALVCGDCKHRPGVGGVCYVNLSWGPRVVWQAWKMGLYQEVPADVSADILSGASVRFGAWGDPAAVPLETWSSFLGRLRAWTGYTHQWRHLDASWHWLMASVDSASERTGAKAAGWRTFRVKEPEEELMAGEHMCLADERGIPCAKCLGCDGTARNLKVDFAIDYHGVDARQAWREKQGLLFGGVK